MVIQSIRAVDLATLADHSQNGEQAIVGRFLQEAEGTYTPFFVDVGAYDGLTGSNTRLLAELGWPGIAVEPNPGAFERLQALYASNPAVRCVQRAVSDHSAQGVEMMISDGPAGVAEGDRWMYSQVSTLNSWFAEGFIEEHGYRYRSIQVDVSTLAEILHTHECPPDLAALFIDCEGEDLRILKAFDFSTFRPRLLSVESDDRNRSLFADVVRPHGYREYDHTASNTFFALQDGR